MPGVQLFKILDNEGKSCNGGSLQWSLPTKGDDGEWTPGEWHKMLGPIARCSVGFHLVPARNVFAWLGSRDRRIFLAEGDGACDVDSGKAAFTHARLLVEITSDWPLLPMYPVLRAALWAVRAIPDLSGADLLGANLLGADLSRAYRPTGPPRTWTPDDDGYLRESSK